MHMFGDSSIVSILGNANHCQNNLPNPWLDTDYVEVSSMLASFILQT